MPNRMTINGPLIWSGLAILMAILAVLIMLLTLGSAAFMPGADSSEVSAEIARLVTDHGESQTTYRDRFNGRSAFFKPIIRAKPRPRPADPTPAPITAPPPTEEVVRPPPVPANYGGPKIKAFVVDSVWFENDLVIKEGEEKQGVVVLEVNPPWGAKLGWKKGEYDVPLFANGFADWTRDEPEKEKSTLDGLIEPVDEAKKVEATTEPATGAVENSETIAPKKESGESNGEDGEGDEGDKKTAEEDEKPIKPATTPQKPKPAEVPPE